MASASTIFANQPPRSPNLLRSYIDGKWPARLGLAGILAASLLLYIWKVDQNGWANAYYSAAVQAGQHDPSAFFFGSSDWGNSITVDKPPLSLWVMGISVRLFGRSPWSILVPQACITVGSTFIIFKLVSRFFPVHVALLTSAVFAMTPITVLLARYNNPDPLMILLMLLALYACTRATEDAQPRFLCLAGLLLALGFLAKQLQAFLILPSLVIIFLTFVHMPWRKRVLAVMAAGGILVSVSLAWPLAVDLTSSEARPFVGGSTGNSMLELTLGYNGINRVLPHADDPSVASIPAEFRSGQSDAGLLRLINTNYGQEIGWLLVPGLLSALAVAWFIVRRGYTRGQSILAGAAVIWMISTYIMLSFMGNSFHSYYTASLAPPLALCFGLGAHILLDWSKTAFGRIFVLGGLVLSAVCSYAMWSQTPILSTEVGSAILGISLLSAAMLAFRAPWYRLELAAGGMAIATLLAGPISCALVTAATPQFGSNPLSGGVTVSENTLSRFMEGVKNGEPAAAQGLAIGTSPSAQLAATLRNADPACTWAAATYPSQTAAQYQLEIDRPVMPLAGFAAQDPSPNLAQFERWVETNRVCYLVEQSAQLGVPGNSKDLLAIQAWVSKNFTPRDIDGVTVYRLVK